MNKFCILSDSGHPCSCSIRWIPDGFSHSALHRPEQILSVKRSCPFLPFNLFYTPLTRKLLFWKDVHIRMSYCTFRQRQGHTSGVIIGNQLGVVCRILCYSEMQKLSCGQGFCAAPRGPEKPCCMCRAAQACRFLLRLSVMWVTSSYMGNTIPVRIIEFHSVIYIRLTFPKIYYNLLITLITCRYLTS